MDDLSAAINNTPYLHQQESTPRPIKRRRHKTPISSCNLIAPNVVAPPSTHQQWSPFASQQQQQQQRIQQPDLDESEKTKLVSRIVQTIKEQTKILEKNGGGQPELQPAPPPPPPLPSQNTNANNLLCSRRNDMSVSTNGGPVSIIDVPPGWHRQLVDNSVIVYISPTGQILTSVDQVRSYLAQSNVCKCGLTCPFRVEDIFNFNADVATSPLSSGCNHHQSWSMASCHSANPTVQQNQPPLAAQQTGTVVKRARGRPRKRRNDTMMANGNVPNQSTAHSTSSAAVEQVHVNVNALDPNSFIRQPIKAVKQQQQQHVDMNLNQAESRPNSAVAFLIDGSAINTNQSKLYVQIPPNVLAAVLAQQHPNVMVTTASTSSSILNGNNQQESHQQCFLVPLEALGATIATTPSSSSVNTNQQNSYHITNDSPQQQQQQHQQQMAPGTPQSYKQQKVMLIPQQMHWQNEDMFLMNTSATNSNNMDRSSIVQKVPASGNANTSQGSACSVQSSASSGYHSANHTPINDSTMLLSSHKLMHERTGNTIGSDPNMQSFSSSGNTDFYLSNNGGMMDHHHTASVGTGETTTTVTTTNDMIGSDPVFYFNDDFFTDAQYGVGGVGEGEMQQHASADMISGNPPSDLMMDVDFFANPYDDQQHATSNNTVAATDSLKHQQSSNAYYDDNGTLRDNQEIDLYGSSDLNAFFGTDDNDYHAFLNTFQQQNNESVDNSEIAGNSSSSSSSNDPPGCTSASRIPGANGETGVHHSLHE